MWDHELGLQQRLDCAADKGLLSDTGKGERENHDDEKQNSGRIKKKSAQPSKRFKALHAKKMNIRFPVKKNNKILIF